MSEGIREVSFTPNTMEEVSYGGRGLSQLEIIRVFSPRKKENFPSYVLKTHRDLTSSHCVLQEFDFKDLQRSLQLPESEHPKPLDCTSPFYVKGLCCFLQSSLKRGARRLWLSFLATTIIDSNTKYSYKLGSK